MVEDKAIFMAKNPIPKISDLILQTNCLSLLQAVPFNFDLATFCFSHSKFFQLKKEDNTLGLRMQQIVNIFNDEFKKELSKHHVWFGGVFVAALR